MFWLDQNDQQKATGSGAVAEAAPASTTADYSRLLADLDAIGWANLQAVNSDFTEVEITRIEFSKINFFMKTVHRPYLVGE